MDYLFCKQSLPVRRLLSREQVSSLKGIFAIVVLIHHLYQSTDIITNRYIGVFLQAAGFFAVSIFFFLSGYGLQISYSEKKQVYIKSFFKGKIIPFYSVIIILIAVYVPMRMLMGEILEPLNIIRSFFFGSTIISKGWYLQVQLFLYLLFFFIWRFVEDDARKMWTLFIIVAMHITLCVGCNVSITRYISMISFNLGIYISDKRDLISTKLENNKMYNFSVFINIIALGITFGLWIFSNGLISIFSQGMCLLFFNVVIILSVQKIKVVNLLTTYFGEYSFSIYIIQGLFLNLYRSSLVYVNNDYLFVCMVVLSTYLAALIIHPVIKFIYLVFNYKKVTD